MIKANRLWIFTLLLLIWPRGHGQLGNGRQSKGSKGFHLCVLRPTQPHTSPHSSSTPDQRKLFSSVTAFQKVLRPAIILCFKVFTSELDHRCILIILQQMLSQKSFKQFSETELFIIKFHSNSPKMWLGLLVYLLYKETKQHRHEVLL